LHNELREKSISFLNALSAKILSKVKVTLRERTLHLPGFAVSYYFSIPLTCGFALTGMCFYVIHARHLAFKGLK